MFCMCWNVLWASMDVILLKGQGKQTGGVLSFFAATIPQDDGSFQCLKVWSFS